MNDFHRSNLSEEKLESLSYGEEITKNASLLAKFKIFFIHELQEFGLICSFNQKVLIEHEFEYYSLKTYLL